MNTLKGRFALIKVDDMQFVFDFHIHAVPEIDDGARSMEESLEILKIAASCGVTDAFCTSHSINFDKGGKNYKEAFEKLCHAAERAGISIKLHKGCEVRCLFRNMESILRGVDDGWFDTLGDTKYVLIELYPHTQINEALQIVKMFTERGYIPVIAKRIRNEEKVLTAGLRGYKEYKTRVKYKVIPFIW